MELITSTIIDNLKVTEAKADREIAEQLGYVHQDYHEQ